MMIKRSLISDMPIKKKLRFICLFVVGISFLLSGAAIVIAESYKFRHAYINEHMIQAGVIGHNCSSALLFNDRIAAGDVLRALENNPGVIYSSVYKKDGTLLAEYRRDGEKKMSDIHIVKEKGCCFGMNYFTLYQPIIFDNENIGTIFIESDLEQFYKTLMWHIAILTLSMFGVFLIALLLITKLQKKITGPIEGLVDLMRRISKEKDYLLEADIRSNDEFGLLAVGFNEMLSQIRSRDAELEQYSKFLENLVNRRTSEISRINELLKAELMEHQRTGKALKELEQKYHNLFDNLNDAAFLTEIETGDIVETNKQGEVLMGMNRDEIIGMKRWMLYQPEEREKYREIFCQKENVIKKPGILNRDMAICRKDGELVAVEISESLIEIGNNRVLIELFRDVTERMKVENQIRRSLEEKEVLLKEIHHRVKNNMQIITSLINLQLENTKEMQAVDMFTNCVNRIKSMALIHEKLYESKDLTRINFGDYVYNLIDHLFSTYCVNSNAIKIRITIEGIFLRINTAIPCGLIINELVSNALKYAFKGVSKGEIEINFFKKNEALSENKNKYVLVVKDNGIGLPADVDIKNNKTLGLRLVHSLSIQLGGVIEIIRDNGAEFRIIFALSE